MKKWLIPVILLLVAGAAYVGFRMREPEPDSTSLIRVSGNIELTEVDIAFKIPGKLTELLVREGETAGTTRQGKRRIDVGKIPIETTRRGHRVQERTG